MALNQQGRLNYAVLDNYTIHGSGLDLGTQFWENAAKELIGSRQSVGVIYGGAVTVVAALTVNVAKGLCLFDNGIMVAWDSQNVALAAADAVNPRLDRIQIAYSLVNDQTVLDNNNNPVILDRFHVATAASLTGVPAGGPVVPATSADCLSLAIISVAANQVALISGNISQIEDTAFNPSAATFGDSNHLFRLNRTRGVFEYSYNGGATWNTLGGAGLPKQVNFAMSPYTVLPTDGPLEVSTAGGNVVINMPSLGGVPFPVEATKSTTDVNTVSMTPNGADPINGAAGADVLAQPFASKKYGPLSASWVIR